MIRHAIDELHIREVIDGLSPPDPRHVVSDGDCVAVMILNILHGRTALYEMGTWLAETDCELLLGAGVDPQGFNDDRLGHCLDRLYEASPEFIFSEVARGVLLRPELGTSYALHADTTSVTLHGAYEENPERPWPDGVARPARGYSKDKRPDLKQLIYGLTVHGPTRIPLGFSVLDGNTADPRANRFQVETLAQLLPPSHDVTLVADCKFVDATTLGAARASGFHYVSLLPHSFNLRDELVEAVRVAGQPLASVGTFPGRNKEAPARQYSATSFVRPFPVVVGDERRKIDHRFVVVRSSTQVVEFDSTIDRRLEKAAVKLLTALAKLAKRDFACETDLNKELARTIGKAEYHMVVTTTAAVEVPRKRPQAGRPRKGDVVPTETTWRLVQHRLERDEPAIEGARFHAAHFVLVTDHVDAADWSDQRIFLTYRGQESVEGHAGFRWLKGVAEVAPVFLNLPHRVHALALVFMLALMVRNWMEAFIRASLAASGKLLPNFLDKPIARPTAENVLWLFRSVIIIATVDDDGKIVHRQVYNLDGYALDVLDIFGVSERLFTQPPRKSRPSVGGMNAM